MNNDLEREIEELFEANGNGISVIFPRGASFLDSIPSEVLALCEVAVAALPLLWKVALVWIDRHANGKITVKYKSVEGKEVSVEYSRLTSREVEEMVATMPPQATAADAPCTLRLEFFCDKA